MASDHNPLLVNTNMQVNHQAGPFRFETAWTRDDRSIDIISEAWVKQYLGTPNFQLYRKMQNTRVALSKWNKEVFGH
jgi:hypothetical protein